MNAITDFAAPVVASQGISISALDTAVIVQTSDGNADVSVELPRTQERFSAAARPVRAGVRKVRGIPELDSPMAG
ncbi:MAG: hypothetical protein ACRED1_11065 [Limisphaerales bacterium]